MELASNSLLCEEIKQTMGIPPRNHSRAEVPQCFGQVEEALKEISSMFKQHLTLESSVVHCSMAIMRSTGIRRFSLAGQPTRFQ
jgi:hypothetical protein